MYYIKENNLISISRGDFIKIPIQIKQGEFPFEIEYKLTDDDIVVFALMKTSEDFNTAFFKQTLTAEDYDIHDNLYITLQPEDTILLSKGTYYYEAKVLYKDIEYDPEGVIVKEDTVIDTVIPKTKFLVI